jgi:hypothetical protein
MRRARKAERDLAEGRRLKGIGERKMAEAETKPGLRGESAWPKQARTFLDASRHG